MNSPDRVNPFLPIKEPIDVLRNVSVSANVARRSDGFVDKIAGHSLFEIHSSLSKIISEISPDSSNEISKRLNDGTLIEVRANDKMIIGESINNSHNLYMGFIPYVYDNPGDRPLGAYFSNKGPLSGDSKYIPAREFAIYPNEDLYANGIKWLCETVLNWNQKS